MKVIFTFFIRIPHLSLSNMSLIMSLSFSDKKTHQNISNLTIKQYWILRFTCHWETARLLHEYMLKTVLPIFYVDISHEHVYNLSCYYHLYCHSLSTKNRDYACLYIVDCWIFNIGFCQRNFDQCHPHNDMVTIKYNT